MKIKNTLYVVLASASLLFIGSCKDTLEEHTKLSNTANSKDLVERIADEPSLSKFLEYVKSSGLEPELRASKTFTIWAPTNEAIAALNSQSPAYLADAANLKAFIKYHIINLTYPVSTKGDTLNAQTLNGKYRTVVAANVDDAKITKADIYAKNGVLHIIDKASPVKSTIWEIAHSGIAGATNILNAMNSLDTTATVPAGTVIKRNPVWAGIAAKMSAEGGPYTYFILKDAAYNQELAKIVPYYKTAATRVDSTEEVLTKTAILKDLLVAGYYTADKIPDTLVSVAGMKIPVTKSAIEATYYASNGIVHVVNALPYRVKDRVPAFIIEGESFRAIRDNSKRANINIRLKKDSVSGALYYDIRAYNHATSEFWMDYRVFDVRTVKYKVYARAFAGMPSDIQTADFTQRYGRPSSATNVNATQVLFTQVVSANVNNKNRFKEVYLGDFTMTRFGVLNWRLLSASVTTIGVNTLILDYVRFEPILP